MNNQTMVNICILGGGFSGLYTALYLSRHPAIKSGQWRITLVERNDRFLFTPLLYELITGELQRWEIAPSYQKLLAGTSNEFCQRTVQRIDLNTRQVHLDNHDALRYDYLLLGLGMQNRWVDIPGLKTHALTFRTLEDVECLQGKLHHLEISEKTCFRVAVIGGGPNGVELSCKLADRLGKRAEVLLVERGNQILKGFSRGVRAAAYRSLGSRRVQLYLNTTVDEITDKSIYLTHVEQVLTVPVDLVIWAAGTQSRQLIRDLDGQQTNDGKLLTRPSLQLIDYPEVFALGDVAKISYQDKHEGIPNTAQAAYQQASVAAKNIAAAIERKPLKSFHYLHLGDMLALGRRTAIVSSFGLNINGQLGGIIRRLAYIFRLPTMRHRLQVLRYLLQKIGFKIRRLFRWCLTRPLFQNSSKDYLK